MGVLKRGPILICDNCEKSVETVTYSSNYDMHSIEMAALGQSGGSGDANKIEQNYRKSKIICTRCLKTIYQESPTLKKILS